MDIHKIQLDVLSVYKRCIINSFPINCTNIITQYGYNLIRYSQLSDKKRIACMMLSQDACMIQDTIYYNDEKPEGRIRFSIMHELGHLILDTDIEQEANIFSSHILAPRMVMYYANCQNSSDVANLFNITYAASDYAFNDYRRWRRITAYKKNFTDKAILDYFFDKTLNIFVYHINHCSFCDTKIYNNPNSHICPLCRARYCSKGFFYDRISDNRLYAYLGID